MRYADLDPILSELAQEGRVKIDAKDIVSIIYLIYILTFKTIRIRNRKEYPSCGIKPEFWALGERQDRLWQWMKARKKTEAGLEVSNVDLRAAWIRNKDVYESCGMVRQSEKYPMWS